jgi:murein L,D-transpeptidase YcbB/YkuD
MFPNPFDVYLHDTPTKSLFEKDYRAYSHGCMRVMNPWDFAQALFNVEPDLTVASLKKLVGGRERRVDLARHIPVHVTYFTAWVDADGTLQVRNDVYGLDERMEKALGLHSQVAG